MKRECRSVEEFERIKRISEGTYGVVYMVSAGRRSWVGCFGAAEECLWSTAAWQVAASSLGGECSQPHVQHSPA
jgi:hypothetical protein